MRTRGCCPRTHLRRPHCIPTKTRPDAHPIWVYAPQVGNLSDQNWGIAVVAVTVRACGALVSTLDASNGVPRAHLHKITEYDLELCSLILQPVGMTIIRRHVSRRGEVALPVETRRRWNIADGGPVEIADLGAAVLVVPADGDGFRGLLTQAIEEAGGYAALAVGVAAEDPDLA